MLRERIRLQKRFQIVLAICQTMLVSFMFTDDIKQKGRLLVILPTKYPSPLISYSTSHLVCLILVLVYFGLAVEIDLSEVFVGEFGLLDCPRAQLVVEEIEANLFARVHSNPNILCLESLLQFAVH